MYVYFMRFINPLITGGGHHLAEIQRHVKAKYVLRTPCDQINFSLSFCKSSVETQ